MSPAKAALFSASTSAIRTVNSSPSRSIRRLTIASNMKQSFGHEEKPRERLIGDRRFVIGDLESSLVIEDTPRGGVQAIDRLGQLPGGTVAPFDHVRDGADLGERHRVDETRVHER